jgi:hypothetical protein
MIRRIPAVLSLMAILGSFIILGGIDSVFAGNGEESDGHSLRAVSDSGLLAAPLPSACLVAPSPDPLHPGLSNGPGPIAERAGGGVTGFTSRSERQHQAERVSAVIREKYQPFTDSLTSP